MSAEILLNDCRIPAENVLPGAPGLVSALKCLNEARFDIIWGSLGAGMDSFEAALAYAGSREQFGRPIAGFQLTQSKLVDMYSELTKARLLALRLGRLKGRGAGCTTPRYRWASETAFAPPWMSAGPPGQYLGRPALPMTARRCATPPIWRVC